MDEMIKRMNAALCVLAIPYVVIGGIAASLRGRPRMTMDSDIVILLSKDDVDNFLKIMKEHGFAVSSSSASKMASRLKRGLPIKLRYRGRYSVDVRIASYSIDHHAIRRANKEFLFEVKLPIATSEDLIVYKLARFDNIDQSDIKAVITRRGRELDTRYIAAEAKVLVAETQNKDIEHHLATAMSWLKPQT